MCVLLMASILQSDALSGGGVVPWENVVSWGNAAPQESAVFLVRAHQETVIVLRIMPIQQL